MKLLSAVCVRVMLFRGAVAAGILISPAAAFENGVPNKGHIMTLIIKDDRIWGMTGRMNYL